jgi:PAS domain S-box-containing protein
VGAQDYLLKGRLDDHLLPKAIAGMIDRAAITEALFDEKERAQVTLNSIGDAVISTDVKGRVTYFNIVAEQLTGWPRAEAPGRQLEDVFRIIDRNSRAVIPNPMAMATSTNEIVGIPATSILIRRDGVESAIEDSCAPIHNRRGDVTGAVMVFHDVSMSRALSQRLVHLAQHDSLTDLPNRDLLNERLSQAIAAAWAADSRSDPRQLMAPARCKPQPHVVGRPLSRRVAEGRLDAFTHTFEVFRAFRLGQHGGEAAAEGREPSHHIARQRRGPRDQLDIADVEAGGGKARTVIFDRRKIPGVGGLAIMSAAVELRGQRRHEGLHATVAAHLRDEPSIGQQRPCDPSDHSVGVLHPVKRGVAERCIEARAEVHVRGALLDDVKAELPCRLHEVGTRVDTHYAAASVGDFLGQYAVTAAHIEDVFTGLWIEQFEDRGTEIRDEASVFAVTLGVPSLGRPIGTSAGR